MSDILDENERLKKENEELKHLIRVMEIEYKHMTEYYYPAIINDLRDRHSRLSELYNEAKAQILEIRLKNPEYRIDRNLRKMVDKLMDERDEYKRIIFG